MNDRDILFYGNDVHGVFTANFERAKKSVDSIPSEQFLASNDDQLVEHVHAIASIEPLVLH